MKQDFVPIDAMPRPSFTHETVEDADRTRELGFRLQCSGQKAVAVFPDH
ncbi:MAG: hypothetical protein QGF00_15660 [Planctomycetota bacterium]|nr:hypothetical protein [Planctomycetota bacterium]